MASPQRPEPPIERVVYAIAGGSDHSGEYRPEMIKVDKPLDPTSRWSASSQSTGLKQWLLLEMDTVCILKRITFGKFHKPHPCNMKDFKIFAGMNSDHLVEVLHSRLKNDATPETFAVSHIDQNGRTFPSKFVKIEILSAHCPNFNISIWHVALHGFKDPRFVKEVTEDYDLRREVTAMRHILQHLRRRRHITAYRLLQSDTSIQLEHPLVTQLYESLVLRGAFDEVENLIHTLHASDLFSSYARLSQPRALWHRLANVDGNNDSPGPRGGHAMCMDSERGLVYLFGGWDGRRSLDDFWVYSVADDRWRIISRNVSSEKNGPTPRACHKMVFDPKTGSIYVLGKLLEEASALAIEEQPLGTTRAYSPSPPAAGVSTRRSVSPDGTVVSGSGSQPASPARPEARYSTVGVQTAFYSEFYRYRTRGLDQGKWELLSFDTSQNGGPPLIYDHQLVIDSEEQIIYVCGGRVVGADAGASKYAGLYSYNIRTSKWAELIPTGSKGTDGQSIPPRYGHCTILDPEQKRLFIFAGQRNDEHLADMWECDLRSMSATQLFTDTSSIGGPEACFAPRAAIDPSLKEIYFFGGVPSNTGKSNPQASSSSRGSRNSFLYLHRYGKRPGQWVEVPASQTCDSDAPDECPIARCAHDVVYDSASQTFYMYGGKPTTKHAGSAADGDMEDSRDGGRRGGNKRLDDFWAMTLKRLGPEEVIRKALFETRQQRFREMCEDAVPVKALSYLQTTVSAVVDHSNLDETAIFRSLLSHLLEPPKDEPGTSAAADPQPESAECHSVEDSEEGSWTSQIPGDEDIVMSEDTMAQASQQDASAPLRVAAPKQVSVTRLSDDPYELELRGGKTLSASRFEQRMRVFESLLQFVNAEAKEPQRSVLDMLDSDDA